MSRHIGIFCLPGRGHLYPAAALARGLKQRGFRITVFGPRVVSAIVKDAGLDFCPIGNYAVLPQLSPAVTKHNGPNTVEVIYRHALCMLKEAPDAILQRGVDALLVDQADLASGTVAELFGIPFITVSFLAPVYLTPEVPPFIFGWLPGPASTERTRNERGNNILRRLLSPTLSLINQKRRSWGLHSKFDINELFSERAIVTQLPGWLDFPRTGPEHLFYTGPFRDNGAHKQPDFPWELLSGKPLIFASLGTVRNNCAEAFRVIAEACVGLNIQLVISLGGMALLPSDIRSVPGDTIVVHYAPQEEILKRAILSITHAGVNTTLQSIFYGVPMVAIPLADDQPGMAARVVWRGMGTAVPFRRLSVSHLRSCIRTILDDSRYYSTVDRFKAKLNELRGLELASDIIECRLFS